MVTPPGTLLLGQREEVPLLDLVLLVLPLLCLLLSLLVLPDVTELP